MAIRVTGMYSGLDTESIISELVSAKSMKKQSLVKAQTKLSWKQDAWKALNSKIYSFYTNVLGNMRYQSSYTKKTTKVSNPNAVSVQTSDSAIDGVRSVQVNQLAKGATLTGGCLMTDDGICFTDGSTLSTLRKYSGMDESANLSGSFRVMGANGQYLDFEVNENTTISDVVKMIQSTGLNCNYDADSQRIFISSKNTGAINNFNIMANDEGGLNALAALGLLSADDINNNKELQKWAGYGDPSNHDAYEQAIKDEMKARQEAYKAANDKLAAANDKLAETNTNLENDIADIFGEMSDSDWFAQEYAKENGGASLSDAVKNLYEGDNSLYNKMQAAKEELDKVNADESKSEDDKAAAKEAYENAKSDFDTAKDKLTNFFDDIAYGKLEDKKDAEGNTVMEKVPELDENGKPKVDKDGKPVYKQKLKGDGTPETDENGNPVYEERAVQVRNGGLSEEWEAADKAGNVPEDLQQKVDALNKWYGAVSALDSNKNAITANEAAIEANEAQIADNDKYLNDGESDPELDAQVREEFDAKVSAAQKSLEAVSGSGAYAGMVSATKVNAQDAEVLIDGAKFTSQTNTFSVNGLTITANEVTDKEVTISTSTDTDGIYGMIKNFFKEYNSLINEMTSLYNAEASTGYEPLTSEEKQALSDSEVEEWEKKIKDSILRRDSTLSSVSFAMTQELLKGVTVNGKQMYLSDFGINTLGYFEAADNERNAYHIDGDSDDEKTKGNEDVLKSMIASDPETVMNFFTKLSTNLYDTLTEKMASTDMSSAFTVYNDKQMKNEYNDYKDKITKEEEKLNALMDKWYKKFSQMEVALSKLESRSSSLSSILGG